MIISADLYFRCVVVNHLIYTNRGIKQTLLAELFGVARGISKNRPTLCRKRLPTTKRWSEETPPIYGYNPETS